MNKKQFIMQGIIAIIIVILLAGQINALGIAPSKKIIDYDTEEHVIAVRVVNTESKDLTFRITASGPLAEYVTINNPEIEMRSDESEKEFTYTIKLPEDINPNDNFVNIMAAQVNSNVENAGSTIGGLMTVTHQLVVNIPYTGKFAEGFFSVGSSTINTPVVFTLNVNNVGTESIDTISGVLRIKNPEGNIVISKEISGYNNIASGASTKIEESLLMENPGTYTAQYDIQYDNKKLNFTKQFDLGDYNVTILSADVKNFKLGTTAKFDIKLLSAWNTAISDTYGEITIKTPEGRIVGSTKTSSIELNPESNTLTAYWDTSNITAGNYLIELKIYTNNKILVKEYPSTISEDGIIVGLKEETTKKNDYTLYIVCCIIIIILGILTIIILKTIKKSSENIKK